MNQKANLWNAAPGGRTLLQVAQATKGGCDLLAGHTAREALARLRASVAPDSSRELVLIRGSDLGPARRRNTQAIHREGARRRLLKPSPDAALLLKETLPMEVLDYRQIVFMHKPVRDCDQHPSLLCWEKRRVDGDERHVLVLLEAYPGTLWSREAVFIFEASHDNAIQSVRSFPRAVRSWIPEARPRPCWAI